MTHEERAKKIVEDHTHNDGENGDVVSFDIEAAIASALRAAADEARGRGSGRVEYTNASPTMGVEVGLQLLGGFSKKIILAPGQSLAVVGP